MGIENCFVCQAQPLELTRETPYQWLEPRRACAEHNAQAVLESGELVSVVLDRIAPSEGSLLNFFLNPVSIEGTKGWCDCIAGWYGVQEEIFPSRNYFEFYVQHVSKRQNLDFLYAFYKQRFKFADSFNKQTVMKALRAIEDGGHEALLWLEHLWALERIAQQALASREKRRIERDELEEIFATRATNKPGSLDELFEVTRVLLNLAEVRFAHLR